MRIANTLLVAAADITVALALYALVPVIERFPNDGIDRYYNRRDFKRDTARQIDQFYDDIIDDLLDAQEYF